MSSSSSSPQTKENHPFVCRYIFNLMIYREKKVVQLLLMPLCCMHIICAIKRKSTSLFIPFSNCKRCRKMNVYIWIMWIRFLFVFSTCCTICIVAHFQFNRPTKFNDYIIFVFFSLCMWMRIVLAWRRCSIEWGGWNRSAAGRNTSSIKLVVERFWISFVPVVLAATNKP